jgi:magnesium-transporting ATPase (P-type)
VNRSKSIVTSRMWGNMLGHAAYQLAVIFFLLFEGPEVFGFEPGDYVERELKENSTHYTFIFNSFVWMQLFNEFNARSLQGEFNVFKGVLNNPLFCGILLSTAGLQAIMVQYGGEAMHVHKDGLSGELWGYSIAFGAGSLPIQQVINLLFAFLSRYFGMCRSRRLEASRRLFSRRVSLSP